MTIRTIHILAIALLNLHAVLGLAKAEGASQKKTLMPKTAEAEEVSWEHAPSSYIVPEGMVYGGAFIDRILPMPSDQGLTSSTWGGENVKPRNVRNGLEGPEWSYWCMSVLHTTDGKEHMFAARWPENSPKGHMTWPNSKIVHAVAESPTGPFIVKEEIGAGHNVKCYQAKDETYVLYAIGRAYSSKSLDGPWTKYDLQYDLRGFSKVAMSNHAFTRREDGSYLMVSRGGHIWVSEDGLKPYKRVTHQSVYPAIPGKFEDPEVWRDEVQYHLIVNDWFGRIAYYLRSRDGIHWVWDSGKAYDVNVARHADGSKESWYKFERPGIRQDALGRATHIYFAVIDSRKDLDMGNDNHSSKIIALPLTVQRRLQVLDEHPITHETREIRLLIRSEDGFKPSLDVDVQSLMFGAPTKIDFGKGCRPLKSETSGTDLIVTFPVEGAGFTAEDYVGKLLGKNMRGEMLYGYARLPGGVSLEPILRARLPLVTSANDGVHTVSAVVENFGQVSSVSMPIKLTLKTGGAVVQTLTALIPCIEPYGNVTVKLGTLKSAGVYELDLVINPDQASAEQLNAKKVSMP